MQTEKELIRRIRSGDKDAFALLVKDLLPSAYKTAYLILRSKEHAEDALQIALEGAYISIMKNRDMANFKAWFYRLVYSRSIDIYRKNQRVTQLIVKTGAGQEMREAETAQELLIQKENKDEMIKFILELKKDQGVPIYLHYYEELSVREISAILDENENTIKARITRGRRKLAEILQETKQLMKGVKSHG
ncbi:RNA polymerase sigma factor [Peribacillus sp. SCS-155]|uniref:RNA polymerase sigma factor n=1 Tax=Peribacillus sedimenti TaxID=3115297 RepID=UPI003906A4B5